MLGFRQCILRFYFRYLFVEFIDVARVAPAILLQVDFLMGVNDWWNVIARCCYLGTPPITPALLSRSRIC